MADAASTFEGLEPHRVGLVSRHIGISQHGSRHVGLGQGKGPSEFGSELKHC